MQRKQYLSRFLLMIIIFTLIALILSFSAWFLRGVNEYRQIFNQLKAGQLDNTKNRLISIVEDAVGIIEYHASREDEILESRLYHRMDEALGIADTIEFSISRTGASQDNLRLLRENLIRFNDNTTGPDLFLITSDSEYILLPEAPSVEGRKMLEGSEFEKNTFIEHIEPIKNGPGQFVEFPQFGNRDVIQTCYIEYNDFFSVFIGCNETRESVRAEIQDQMATLMDQGPYTRNEVFGGDYNGIKKLGPFKGVDFLEMEDKNGLKIVREFIRVCQDGGGFVQYIYPDSFDGRHEIKLTYAAPLEKWSWYIAAGIYIDDIANFGESEIARIKSQQQKTNIIILACIFAAIALLVPSTFYYKNQYKKEFANYYNYLRTSASRYEPLDLEKQKYEEFRIIGQELNSVILGHKKELQEKEVLLREIHHRVKNNLQIIHSLLSLQMGNAPEGLRKFFEDSSNRIQAMALVHEQLYESSNFSSIDIKQYLQSLADRICSSSARSVVNIVVNTDNLELPLDSAITLGLICNEILNNAFKHGFPKGRDGNIEIHFVRTDHDYRLSVSNDGLMPEEEPDLKNATSLGIQLIVSLSEQLGGTITLDTSRLFHWELVFPVKAATGSDDQSTL